MRTATTYEAVARPTTPNYAEAARFARNIALFALAPLVALAYVLAFPFVGLAALGWIAIRAARARAA
jgi:hypothetical protein